MKLEVKLDSDGLGEAIAARARRTRAWTIKTLTYLTIPFLIWLLLALPGLIALFLGFHPATGYRH
jgi:membrane-bound ClpP family serine protease